MRNPIFQKYDIRGRYPQELHEQNTYKIARAFAHYLHAKNIVVGRDARRSSPALWEATIQGLRDAGVNVTDIGLCTTPMLYYASTYTQFDGAIMITASHLPKTYNGLKLCKKNAVALSYGTGLEKIERNLERPAPSTTPGTYQKKNITQDYTTFMLRNKKHTKLRVAVDCGNMMGVLDLAILKKICTTYPLYTTLDGSMPNRGPDPSLAKNLRFIKKEVRKRKADLGIAFDADADRVIFIDEHGNMISPDLITAFLASYLTKPGDTILFDVSSSMYAQHELIKRKRKIILNKSGHSLMMLAMRDNNATLGGEKSGHYYFKQFFYADNALYTALSVIAILQQEKKTISTLIKHIAPGFRTPELNYKIKDKENALQKIESTFTKHAQHISHLDGATIIYPDYWFNIRKSNTQPLIRVNIEARTQQQLNHIKKEITKILKHYQ